MGRRKSSAGGTLLIVVVGLLALTAKFIEDNWQLLATAGALVFLLWIASKAFGSKKTSADAKPASVEPKIQVTLSNSVGYSEARMAATKGTSRDVQKYWVGAAKTATVHGRALGSLLYVGTGLMSVDGPEVEAALIDPKLEASTGSLDLSVRRLGYWPSYATASPEARGAYLSWLSSGRSVPEADLGLVFLYFYGLERRSLIDAQESADAKAEVPQIIAEVERLLGIYRTSRSFNSYAGALLDQLSVGDPSSSHYLQAPQPTAGRSLRFRDRLALGQCAAAGVPLPASWALTWLELDVNTKLPIAARRCHEQFEKLFVLRYAEEFGAGLVLPKNKTRLHLDYRPASPSLRGCASRLGSSFDLPDVTVLTSPLKRLRDVGERCAAELSGYSRKSAAGKVDSSTLEGLSELPFILWPDPYRHRIRKVAKMVRASGQPLAVPFDTVKGWLPAFNAMGKPLWRQTVRRFREAGLGVEPDPDIGGLAPDAESRLAFFPVDAAIEAATPSPQYAAAAMTLQLAAAVAAADGHIDELERTSLTSRIESALHLSSSEQQRLHAHLRRVLTAPPKITGLTRQVNALEPAAREAVGAFVVSVAVVDGIVTKSERKTLERIFKVLSLDTASLPAVSATSPASEPTTVLSASPAIGGRPVPAAASSSGFSLDLARVNALQAETERVALMLGNIFQSQDADANAVDHDADKETPVAEKSLWGLPSNYEELARVLLSRAQWSRAELQELAKDRDLMLEGTLEKINEACVDATGAPLLEGEDPLEVNRDVLNQDKAAQ